MMPRRGGHTATTEYWVLAARRSRGVPGTARPRGRREPRAKPRLLLRTLGVDPAIGAAQG